MFVSFVYFCLFDFCFVLACDRFVFCLFCFAAICFVWGLLLLCFVWVWVLSSLLLLSTNVVLMLYRLSSVVWFRGVARFRWEWGLVWLLVEVADFFLVPAAP